MLLKREGESVAMLWREIKICVWKLFIVCVILWGCAVDLGSAGKWPSQGWRRGWSTTALHTWFLGPSCWVCGSPRDLWGRGLLLVLVLLGVPLATMPPPSRPRGRVAPEPQKCAACRLRC